MSEAATNESVPALTACADNKSLASREQMSTSKRPRLRSQNLALYQCHICQHSYQRADRFSRHLKSHENARRYICHICQKGFNRADLLSRHVLTHKRKKATTGSESLTNIHKAERTSKACFACASAKARCEEQKPCQRCKARKIECEIPGLLNPSRGTGNEHSPDDNDQSCTALGWENYAQACNRKDSSEQQPRERQELNPSITPEAQQQLTASLVLDPYDMHIPPFYDSQFMYEAAFDNVMFTPNVPQFNYQNIDLSFHGLAFPDQLYNPSTSLTSRTTNNQAAAIETLQRPPRPERDIRAGREVFARSPWLFTPELRDYIFRDVEDLTLDENNISSALSSFWSVTPDTLSGELPIFNTPQRDEMHYLLSTMNTYTRRIPRFPSVDILNDLSRAFLTRHASQIDSWLHMPMLRLSEAISELNLALILGGSTVISISSMCKLGHVLQDVCERQNSAVRKLQPLQAWMLLLDAGLWSGFQRQKELSENFEKTVVTMVRRGGMFGASTDAQSLIPRESDEGPVLENKWKKWVQCESFKSSSDLRDFYAVAVYHAGILLWVYGHLSISHNSTSNRVSQQSPTGLGTLVEGITTLVINGEETDATKAYIAGRPTTPILTHVWKPASVFDNTGVSAMKFIQLEDPNAILKIARNLYQNNFPVGTKILPPLVNNLGKLMSDLAEMSEKRLSRCASLTGRGRTAGESI
ncbi:hypothetical protein TCE0_050r18298 [Talaromyces pinophilus]|uniref:Uncharacterized protein n=1 Tax=Talaromyces pinophilus TaxID=128442 RepID=A0A0B8N7D6_TALPI|nr:hypothetical protein TCE0_050r18298 [Talaromyces pinophilus]